MKEELTEPPKKKKTASLVEVIPLKDFVIKQNSFFYDLKKGIPHSVHEKFIQNLKTEEVI